MNERDEWHIAPVTDEDKKLIGLIMQVGYSYAIKAYFEQLPMADNSLVLRYAGMLPQEQLISFDDIFVATNVTIMCYTPKKVEQNIAKYEDYFQECQKLRLYLINEFATQRRIMVNSPMSVYLAQWAEITNRLIEILSYGSHILVSVTEWNYFKISGIGCYTVLKIDDSEKFYNLLKRKIPKADINFLLPLVRMR